MMRDDAGVAGFFEDLPVMMFVLAGVVCVVVSSTWVCQQIESARAQTELEEAAERIVQRFLADARSASGIISVSSLRCLEPSGLPEESEVVEFALSVAQLYPEAEWLFSHSTSSGEIGGSRGSASRLFNALSDSGTVVIVEVRVVVWQG